MCSTQASPRSARSRAGTTNLPVIKAGTVLVNYESLTSGPHTAAHEPAKPGAHDGAPTDAVAPVRQKKHLEGKVVKLEDDADVQKLEGELTYLWLGCRESQTRAKGKVHGSSPMYTPSTHMRLTHIHIRVGQGHRDILTPPYNRPCREHQERDTQPRRSCSTGTYRPARHADGCVPRRVAVACRRNPRAACRLGNHAYRGCMQLLTNQPNQARVMASRQVGG
ncbi:hypothetical protein EVG20_g7399 [Dentipellis fragilis]|uniref:Uncharacterized protein n=1 Tax=Dentipellis fragilis TaxID=205917 RepID=A0A4Y9YFZ8_9AGAM|nr:hypothetical protein EVG20_g7399 [Dentipellis fragilis]